MINANMRTYDFYKLTGPNAYGQFVLPKDASPHGQVKMAISLSSQSIQDNINYQNCNYVGLTHSLLDDKCVIQYGDQRLKVLYVNNQGRYNQVFLGKL